MSLFGKHKGKQSRKMHFDLAFESISPWAGSDPVKIEWARGSQRRGSLGPFRPTGGPTSQVKINQTISIPVTLFHVRRRGPRARISASPASRPSPLAIGTPRDVAGPPGGGGEPRARVGDVERGVVAPRERSEGGRESTVVAERRLGRRTVASRSGPLW